MQSLFWLLANRTAETQFIFNLFHLLLAGLTLLALLHQLRASQGVHAGPRRWMLPLGFVLLVLQFAALALYFGAGFFFQVELGWANFERLSQGLMACGFLVVVAGCMETGSSRGSRQVPWVLMGCAVVAVAVLVDILRSSPQLAPGERPHSVATLFIDSLVLLAVGLGIRVLYREEGAGKFASVMGLATAGLFLVLDTVSIFLPRPTETLSWNLDQHLLSVSLFAFAWAAGERSRNLLDRIFVRLNLTFIILASLIMLITVGMEKYQYLRLAEERSMDLAEFLRGHIVYYRERRDSLEKIFRHPEVMRRVVVEFGTLPELREVSVYLDGWRATFRKAPDWEIKEKIVSLAGQDGPEASLKITNSFQMIRLPLGSEHGSRNRIEFWGTMDYINEYIGKYIILIYSLFTIMVALASAIVGIIVNDADRRLRQQYAELRETQQQLAQAAKLASVGQLAGGMAHEINNPVTSILSLASHLAREENAARLPTRNRKSLQVIVQQAERVSRIVGNLLTFARQSSLDMSRVDVAELLDTAIAMMQYRLRDSGIRLSQEIDPHLPPIMGDADRLTEVFVNLFSNAIDAMPSGGKLVVRASGDAEPDNKIRVEVVDSGQGIPCEHLPRIFDPFFTTKEPGRGTGLGLSISHGIVKDHGGQIWAESQLGTGTTLVILLPTGGNWG